MHRRLSGLSRCAAYGKGQYLRIFVVGLIVSLAVVACGQPEATPTPTPAPTPTPVDPSPTDPAATPTATPDPVAEWEREWEETMAAAEREGTVVVTMFSARDREKAERIMAELLPNLNAEFQIGSGAELFARIQGEREAGISSFDVYMSGSTSALRDIIPAGGVLGDLRESFIFPEITDDATWVGTVDDRWADDDTKQYIFNYAGASARSIIWVNRQHLSVEEFNSLDDLFKPELSGRWCSYDPRVPGAGATIFTELTVTHGEDYLYRLLAETDPVISRDGRAMAEDLIRGDLWACVGPEIEPFQLQGVGLHVEPLAVDVGEIAPEYQGLVRVICCGAATGGTQVDGFMSVGSARVNVGAYQDPPNPNAAKVFINTLLSREGQELLFDETDTVCSFRVDMQDWCQDNVNSEVWLPIEDGKGYVTFHRMSNLEYRVLAQDIARQALGE